MLGDDIERPQLLLAHAIPGLVSAVAVGLFMVDWRLALASMTVTPAAAVLIRRGMTGSSGHIAAVSAAAAG